MSRQPAVIFFVNAAAAFPVYFFTVIAVKYSATHVERIFMSWWALDWYIGQDKAPENDGETGTTFYASLKFWRRKDSDMWDFAGFFHYWGWNL